MPPLLLLPLFRACCQRSYIVTFAAMPLPVFFHCRRFLYAFFVDISLLFAVLSYAFAYFLRFSCYRYHCHRMRARQMPARLIFAAADAAALRFYFSFFAPLRADCRFFLVYYADFLLSRFCCHFARRFYAPFRHAFVDICARYARQACRARCA